MRSLGVSKGSFSTVENGPFVIKKETPYSVSFRLHFLRVLREVAKSGERDGVVDRHLAEHLAVDLDALDLQAVHEGGVVHAVHLAGGGDAGDPQK